MRLVMIAGGDLTRVSCLAVPETLGPKGPAGRPSACMELAVCICEMRISGEPAGAVSPRVLIRSPQVPLGYRL